MRSYLDFEGVYDRAKRYIVKNWSDEDFSVNFGAETVYNDNKVIQVYDAFTLTINAGEMRELGQFQAYTFTKHFVDHNMMKDAAKLEDPKAKERGEAAINIPDLRKPYEDKTIQEIEAGKAVPFMDTLREQIRQEEIAKLNAVQKEAVTTANTEVKLDKKPTEKVKEFES